MSKVKRVRFSTFEKLYKTNKLSDTFYGIDIYSTGNYLDACTIKEEGFDNFKNRCGFTNTQLIEVLDDVEGFNKYNERIIKHKQNMINDKKIKKIQEKAKKMFNFDFGYSQHICNGLTTNKYDYIVDVKNKIVGFRYADLPYEYNFVSQEDINRHSKILK